MEVKIQDYLSSDEVKEIVKDELKGVVNRYFRGEKELERVISNAAYGIVWKMVENQFGESLKGLLSRKVKWIISEMTEYHVFKKPTAWDNEPNGPYKYLQERIKENYTKIDEIVKENIEKETLLYLKEDIAEAVRESIVTLFKEA